MDGMEWVKWLFAKLLSKELFKWTIFWTVPALSVYHFSDWLVPNDSLKSLKSATILVHLEYVTGILVLYIAGQ